MTAEPHVASPASGEVVSWSQLLRSASQLLAEAGIASPQTDALRLAEYVAGTRLLTLAPIPRPAQLQRFAELVERRQQREPLQHITEEMTFRYLDLHAGPGAFVVRPETELVAGEAIAAAADRGEARVVDLCSGSGAIALAVATEVPGSQVWAVELSEPARVLAERNIARHAAPVHLVAGDAATALGELDGTIDVVVANPPYIPCHAEPRDLEVRDHDPAIALYGGGSDGLAVSRAVIARAAGLLREGGSFIMEHGEDQTAAVGQLLACHGAFDEVNTKCDLAGRDRMVVARRRARVAGSSA